MSEMFYSEVIHVVILLGLELWFLLESIEKTVEGAHTSFLRQITGNQARWMTGGTWVTLVVEEVR